MVQAHAQQQLYTHAAEPKAVQQRKAKYREDETQQQLYSTNIMFDRRVVRGNTYAARILPADLTLTEKKTSSSATTSTQTRKKTSSSSNRTGPPRTPDAVHGRRHADIQTDVYLEELCDVVQETDVNTQTDAFLDRPPTPLFVPQKTGVDATTQIDHGDLFDFDLEVEPLVEVLVGKVLEQGLCEVLQEEELAAMRAHQQHFEAVRAAELVATQRLEAAEARKASEKDRRLAQEKERLERERLVRRKVAASTFARGFLSGIVGSVFDGLQAGGFFYDPVLRDVQDSFMPWLRDQAVMYVEQGMIARQVVQRLVTSAAEQLGVSRDAAAAAATAQEAARQSWQARQAALRQAAVEQQAQDIMNRATFILDMQDPAVADQETVSTVRAELVAAAEAAATAAYEAAVEAAGQAARDAAMEALAKLAEEQEAARQAAEQQQGDEELQAQEDAPQEVPAGGDGGQDPQAPDNGGIDVEAQVAAAQAAVVKPEPKAVTDQDVLSALLDRSVVTKDTIIQALALHELGDQSYTRIPVFTPAPVQ